MADAGRIQHHLCHTLSDPNNTVLITGYCSPHSVGGKLLRGDEQVRIFNYVIDVRAKIESVQSLSAHGDSDEILRFLSCQEKSTVKTIFLVHGETKTKKTFRKKLLDEGFTEVRIPISGEEVTLH
jgi:metallo-beta-lactamase family protein